MKIGLKIDVDTLRGTKDGVIPLLKLFRKKNIKATFFFSVGPDNMGRNLYRLLKPKFFLKMLRSKAANLYGWDILLRGTLGTGPIIGDKCREIIKDTAKDGHEIGLHAWDHYTWQTKMETSDNSFIRTQISLGIEKLREITGLNPVCSAAPAWTCNDAILKIKEEFSFVFNSDCRGRSVFIPEVQGKTLTQIQIPTTLPTYDEIIGHNGINHENYNDKIISLMKPDDLNILTIHAEAEGILCHNMFSDFIDKIESYNGQFTHLGSFIADTKNIPKEKVMQKTMEGRDGTLAVQFSHDIAL
ncbi:MAG: hypothetical protein ACD_79C01418G0002 [uncultured bacterium]|nr:MAG: hypothetical protein ACD_79C01418G0002 [uncultured bacterium]